MNPCLASRDRCPGCSSQDVISLLEIPYTDIELASFIHRYYRGKITAEHVRDGQYVLDDCQNCHLIYQRNIPNDELSRILYEPPEEIESREAFEKNEGNRSLGYFLAYLPGITDVIRYFKRSPRKLNFLDFGMGWGNWCQLARGLGCNCYGLESSSIRIENAARFGIQTISWSDIGAMQFDFVNCNQVLEHVSAPFETLVHLKRALRDDSLLLLSVPDCWRLRRNVYVRDWDGSKSGSRRSMRVAHPLEHINSFTNLSLIALANRAGFTLAEVPRTTYPSIKEFVKDKIRPFYWYCTGRASTHLFFKKQ